MASSQFNVRIDDITIATCADTCTNLMLWNPLDNQLKQLPYFVFNYFKQKHQCLLKYEILKLLSKAKNQHQMLALCRIGEILPLFWLRRFYQNYHKMNEEITQLGQLSRFQSTSKFVQKYSPSPHIFIQPVPR